MEFPSVFFQFWWSFLVFYLNAVVVVNRMGMNYVFKNSDKDTNLNTTPSNNAVFALLYVVHQYHDIFPLIKGLSNRLVAFAFSGNNKNTKQDELSNL